MTITYKQNLQRIARSMTAIAASGISIAAVAAPPITTDDASTLDPGACQFEVERRRFKSQAELDVVAACNLIGNTEFAIGKLRVTADGDPRADSVVVSIKRVLHAGTDGGWSAGFNAASVRATGNASGTRQNLVTAIFSRPIDATGDTLLHINGGWVNDREADADTRRNRFAWAAAVESNVSSRWTVVGEVFGQQSQPASAQVGLRWWAVPNHVQFTTSVGGQRGMGRDGRWISLGIRFESGGPLF